MTPGTRTSEDRELASCLSRWESSIRSRLGSRLRTFRLDVQQDGVVLKGHAINYYTKQLAQHAFMELSHQRIVANVIEVR